MRRLRPSAVLLPLALTVAASGCGIQATDVVEVGDPATVEVAPGRGQGTVLYFVSPPPARRLMPVVRPADSMARGMPDASGAVPVWRYSGKAILMLLYGPDSGETAAGLRTELPRADVVSTPVVGPDGVLVRLNAPVKSLSAVARQQLACTVAQAVTSDRTTEVRVRGSDGTIGPDRCRL